MSLQKLTDEEIAARLKENLNAALFSELMQRYEKRVIHQCKQYLKDEETAKDVSQEVFIRLLTKIGSFRQEAAFATWLHTIIHNRCTDHLRKDKKALHKEISREIVETLVAELDTDDVENLLQRFWKSFWRKSGAKKNCCCCSNTGKGGR